MAKSKNSRKPVRTQNQVRALKAEAKRYNVRDADLRGHYIRVEPTGAMSFWAVARNPDGKQIWSLVGPADAWEISDARETAREVLKRVKAGLSAFETPPPAPDTFEAVAKNYIKRHVEAKGLRSQAEIKRCLEKYIYPSWRERDFRSIGRQDIATLLDKIQDNNGDRQADYVLAIISGITHWFTARDDTYTSPIARGMRRSNPTERQRKRTLDDDEIRLIWKLAEANGTFGAILRIALLTAQRRKKILTMRWQDVSIDGEWSIPAEPREKGTPGVLVLPELALEIIRAQKRIGKNPYVFAGRGEGHANGLSKAKVAFDQKVLTALRDAAEGRDSDPEEVAPLPHWTIHDLRRTARTLMARASVDRDIAERVMGHQIVGVEGTYDQFAYRDQKADALKRLAGLIQIIVTPPPANVIKMAGAG